MTRIAALLSHIRPTTFAFELSRRIAERSDFNITVISYYDQSIDEISVPITDSVEVITIGAESRVDNDAIRYLKSLLWNEPYDIIHTHHNFVGSLGRLLSPRRTAIVTTEHANHRQHYSLIQNIVNISSLWKVDKLVANSKQTLESLYLLERALVPSNKCQVIYNGVNIQQIDQVLSETNNPYKTPEKQITTVGRMSETKNQETLIKAFSKFLHYYPQSRLTIVGEGELHNQLQDTAEQHNVDSNTYFTGLLPRIEVYRILSATDIFVMPSSSEGFCNALVEAMAFKLPVVISDISIFHEIVGKHGLYADPTSPEEFADQIRHILYNNRHYNTMAENAGNRARKKFSLNRAADEYCELYKNTV